MHFILYRFMHYHWYRSTIYPWIMHTVHVSLHFIMVKYQLISCPYISLLIHWSYWLPRCMITPVCIEVSLINKGKCIRWICYKVFMYSQTKEYTTESYAYVMEYFWSKVHIWVVNSLRPSDAYMRQQIYHHWFRYWLVAWTAQSHYLNQCLNIINCTLRNKRQWNLNQNWYIFIQENGFENVVWKMAAILSRPQCVNCARATVFIFDTWTDVLVKVSKFF